MQEKERKAVEAEVLAVVERCQHLKTAYEGARVLVTGAQGFLGRYLTRALRNMGSKVLATDLVEDHDHIPLVMSVILEPNPPSEIDHICPLDILNETQVRAAFTEHQGFHYVFNCAGIPSPADYRARPIQTLNLSFKGTDNLLSCLRNRQASFGPGKMIFFSSSEIYGNPDVVPTPEDYPGLVACDGSRSCYDEGKRVGEALCAAYQHEAGVPYVAIRPFNVYGPGMSPNDSRVLPNWAKALKSGEPLVVYGDGRQTRTYCYVQDAVVGILIAAALGKGPYNVGVGGPEISAHELAVWCMQYTDSEAAVDLQPYPTSYPSNEPMRRCADLSRLRGLGYKPQIDLGEGLKRFFEALL